MNETMKFEHHHYFHQVESPAIMAKLDRLLGLAVQEKKDIGEIMALLDDVEQRVTEETTVVGSAVTLLQELKSALDAAGTDPVRLKALSDKIGANKDALAAAVVANTPAA